MDPLQHAEENETCMCLAESGKNILQKRFEYTQGCFIRDAAKWPLDLSHNFSPNLSRCVPYLSLIIKANLDRLSLTFQ